ncbi:MAG TPA: hypothetical protein PLA43_03275 [Bryobacteraceae bacterium]|nr:hypothetical protein [Bryobacteraceae bacterium]
MARRCGSYESAVISAFVLAVLMAAGAPSLRAENGARAEFVGGTISLSGGRGVIDLTHEEFFIFHTKRAGVRIPYESVNLLEYGQQVSRRYAMAVVISPLLLLSKSRKHFLTIGYTDEEGRQQAIVLQVDKSHIRPVLAGLEAKTGRRVEYQDQEARKAGKG